MKHSRFTHMGIIVGVGLIAGTVVGAIAAQSTDKTVERGRYLVTAIGGCNDCHTPFRMGPNGPEPDMSHMLSGHPAAVAVAAQPKLESPWGWAGTMTNTAFSGPWGVSYAINLTPDMETGLGAWTEEAFVGAMKTGKHMSVGRPILPPMPWPTYRNMSDADLKAIYAYLKTVPAVQNPVPEAQMAPMPK
jgi:mono/diheme cytochrome c family protein